MPPKSIPPKISVQPYSGSPETVEFFFDQLTEIKELNGYSDRETLAILKSKIQDQALDFYLDAIVKQNFDSLAKVRDEFIKFFGRKYDKCKASNQLDKCSMLVNENPRAFACRIRKLCRFAFPSFDNTTLDSIAFNYFLKNLPRNIKFKLLEEKVDSLESAIDRSEQLLVIYSLDCETENASVQPICHLSHTRDKGFQPSPSKIFQEKKQKHQQNFSQRNSNSRQRLRSAKFDRCSFCAIRGHVMKDCFKFQALLENNSINSNKVKDNKLPKSKPASPKKTRHNLNYSERRR